MKMPRPGKSLPILAPVLIALATSAFAPHALAQGMGGMGGDMGGGGMGGDMGGGGGDMGGGPPSGGDGAPRAPRQPKPIKRERFDQVVTAMFREADTDRNGTVTLDELHAIVEARRAEIIRTRFARVDADHNGSISVAEFTAWQRDMGSAASQEGAAIGDRDGPIAEAIMPDAGKDPEDRMLAALIEPLTGTVIAKANTNYDAGVSLEELLAYEGKLFEAADADHDGYLTMEELRPKGKDGGRMRGGPGGPGPMGGPPPR
ncbi:EF-hand domain-containing protein [Novosphingobium resinovorum]|uniref:EF-hand domain-containing protein n=1 Tax=Novosphingobium resinovorum TaxID=158500 RepID=UPI002ED053F4|nr:EF-hand domain-containing protein [Novosphingobium resinovorum]